MVVERLKSHELFGLLSPKDIEALSAASGVMKLKEGERVYSDGTPASHVFVLLKGRVELRRATKGGVSFLVDDLMEGSLFGISSLTGIERYILNAECVEDSEILKLEVRAFNRILDAEPVVGLAIYRHISQVFFKRYVDTMGRLQAVLQPVPVG
jgi:CRP-like cAMP-binding protein